MEETIEKVDADSTEEVKEETGFTFVDGVLEAETDEDDFGKDYVEPTESEKEVVEESKEVQEQTEEAPIEEIKDIPHKEDPSRFEFWQKKFTEEQNARKELDNKFQSLSEKLENPKAPIEEVKPLTMPEKPRPDADGNIDPLEKLEYLEKQNAYLAQTVDKISGTFEQQERARAEAERSAYLKAKTLGEYQGVGVEATKSQKMYDFFTSEESIDPKIGEVMFDAVMAYKGQSQINPKTNQMKAKAEKYKVPPPPGVVSGTTDEPSKEPSFAEDLLGYQKSTY